jgi:hypothetical protein
VATVTGVVGRGVARERLPDAEARGDVAVVVAAGELGVPVLLDELAADPVVEGAPLPAAEQAPSGSRETAASSASERMTHCGR